MTGVPGGTAPRTASISATRSGPVSVAAFAGDGAAQLALADRHLEARRGGPPMLKTVLAAEQGLPAGTRQ